MGPIPWWLPLIFALYLLTALYVTFIQKRNAKWWWGWTIAAGIWLLVRLTYTVSPP